MTVLCSRRIPKTNATAARLRHAGGTLLAITLAIVLAACSKPSESDSTLDLIKQWVNGYYNNVAQAEADLAAGLPPEQSHRPMHQLFVPVDVPGIEGYLVFQQSSLDGSENPAMIFRHGLMQYLPGESGVVRQRELYFNDPEAFKNAHRDPAKLAEVTLDDMNWNAECDFLLERNTDGTKIAGPIPEGTCVLFNEGLQKDMYADDWVEITPNSYAFRGRYVDEAGNVLWGTESEELNYMTRQPEPAAN